MSKKIKIESKRKKEKWSLLNLKEESEGDILSAAHIEIYFNQKITVDGCLGVYEYRDTYMKLRLNKGSLILCGSGFNIVFFENKMISIKGKISAVEFV